MMLNRVCLWARAIVLRRRLEREMQEEMAEHLRRSTARLMARGLFADEASRAALREFGNVALLQDEGRDARGAGWVDALAADVRFALRHFARTPGTTLTMLMVLAVGMSISTLLFSFVHSYAVQPPPGMTRESDLVRIRGSRTAGVDGRGPRTFLEDEFLEYRKLADQFRAVAGWTDATMPLVVGGDAEHRSLGASVTFVTENYFSILGVRPAMGPGLPALLSDDPATAAVAVIGYATWEHLFGMNPAVIGSTVIVSGVPITIVGVAPERFNGVGLPYHRLRLWMPLSARRLLLSEPSGEFRAAGRLRPNISLRAATAAVQLVVDRTAAVDEELRKLEPSTDVVPLLSSNGDPMFERDVRMMSALIGLLGLLVLLVTCTNVSALLMGLAMARRQEIAVRLSLGAARARLVRQLLTESTLLASVAGGAALGIVWLVLRAVARLIPALPFEMGITWQATTFTLGVCLAVGVLFGLSPALHGTRLALAIVLRDSTATIAAARGRLQRGLVAAQIAFTQPLIVLLAAVLLLVLGEFQPQRRTELAHRLITMSLRPAAPITGSSPAASESRRQLRVTTRRLIDRLRATPGVEAAVIDWGSASPLGAYVVHPEDRVGHLREDAVLRLSGERASEGYFRVMGIPLLRGRQFAPTEAGVAQQRHGEVAVIIGADLAQRLWAGADPIGRRLRAVSDSATGARTLEVVGVIDDPLADTRKTGENYRIYLPPDTGLTPRALLVRTAGAAQSSIPILRTVVQEEVTGMVASIRSLAEIEEEQRRDVRLGASGISAAGLMALLLSAIGLYAVVTFSVGQRTREIAVRMAVGACDSQIVRRFVADGLRLSAIGLALGLPISLIGLRALLTLDDDFSSVALGPVTAIAMFGVILVATAAAWIPARRAAAVDPAVALRSE